MSVKAPKPQRGTKLRKSYLTNALMDIYSRTKKQKEMKRVFYRVGSVTNQQGLWYTPEGEFTGSIHDKYDFCTNSKLQMPFDPKLQGWLSATPDLKELFFWFPLEDIKKLEEHGFSVMKYEAVNVKEYIHTDYKHLVIEQKTSKLVEIIHSSQLVV